MQQSFPRPLAFGERALLEYFLAREFPGVSALREQVKTVRVKGLGGGLSVIPEFEVTDASAPRAEVRGTVPIEAVVRDAVPPREVLLFVKQGLLHSLELVDYSGNEPSALPDVGELAEPTIYPGTDGDN
jgi:hypothetical protein